MLFWNVMGNSVSSALKVPNEKIKQQRTKHKNKQKNAQKSFHENLVRQRDARTDWESIYTVIDEIGHSGFGICNVYKIKKKNESVGGSSNQLNVRLSGNRNHHRRISSGSDLLKMRMPSPFSSGHKKKLDKNSLARTSTSPSSAGVVAPPPPPTAASSSSAAAASSTPTGGVGPGGVGPGGVGPGGVGPGGGLPKIPCIVASTSSSSFDNNDNNNNYSNENNNSGTFDFTENRKRHIKFEDDIIEEETNEYNNRIDIEAEDENDNDDDDDDDSVYDSNENNEHSDLTFALKMINLSLVPEDRIEQLKNEVEILKTLDHKNIIKAYETFPVKADQKLCIVMELCTGGDLHARLPYTESEASNVTRQIISAIFYIHEKNIIHRDLKFENVVFESKHPEALIKIIDFGLSKQYSAEDPVLTERVGTLYSMSPETMQGIYTTKADMWSIGVCTYMLLANGEKPFEGKTPKEVVAKVINGDYKFDKSSDKEALQEEGTDDVIEENDDNKGNLMDTDSEYIRKKPTGKKYSNCNSWDNISTEAKDFISKLLLVNPDKRLCAREAMCDPWFSSRAIARRKTKSKIDLIQRVQQSIVKYANDTGEFRKLALNVIAKNSTSNEIFELRKAFDDFDTENTGKITLDSFKKALLGLQSNATYTDEEIENIFRKVDVNRNNEINYTEFLAATLETQGKISEQRLAEAFDLMDSDDTGYISRANLKQILGKSSNKKYIDRLMEEADIFRDGKISYQEFVQVLSPDTDIITRSLRSIYASNGEDSSSALGELNSNINNIEETSNNKNHNAGIKKKNSLSNFIKSPLKRITSGDGIHDGSVRGRSGSHDGGVRGRSNSACLNTSLGSEGSKKNASDEDMTDYHADNKNVKNSHRSLVNGSKDVIGRERTNSACFNNNNANKNSSDVNENVDVNKSEMASDENKTTNVDVGNDNTEMKLSDEVCEEMNQEEKSNENI